MAPVVPYVKQTWIDNNGANPLSAARMGVLEEGILDVSQAPAVRVFHNANQATTSGTLLALAFNSERYDQAGGVASTMHDTVTNNSRLTCLYAGIYRITAQVEFDDAANTGGTRQLRLRLNGATNIGITNMVYGGNNFSEIQVSTDYSLAVNDYVEAVVLQTSTVAKNVLVSANYSPEFMMVRVG